MEPIEPADELLTPEEPRRSPLHGFQGNRALVPETPLMPAALTIAVSREAGSRGGTIARRAGRKLGWQVYNQELLEYIAQEGAFRQDFADNLPPAARAWTEQRLESLLREQNLSQNPTVADLARLVLGLASQGEVILIGRGAGYILPSESTLHVRVMAPLDDRIAYMSQWLRLTVEEAAELVELRDKRRAEFIATHFHRQTGEVYQYDLLLNSSLLGEDLAADLITLAARSKSAARLPARHAPPPWAPQSLEPTA
jgi:cytidylate kinase